MKFIFSYRGRSAVCLYSSGIWRGHLRNEPSRTFSGHDKLEAEARFRDIVDAGIDGTAGVWSERYEPTGVCA